MPVALSLTFTMLISAAPACRCNLFFTQDMWGRNGDDVSRCVTGTGALSGGAKTSVFKDVRRSVVRTIKNNFMDAHRQMAIDIILGKFHEGNVVEG